MRLMTEALMVLLAVHAVGAEPFGTAYTSQWSAALNVEIDGRIENFRKADGEFAIPGLAAGSEVFVEQIESDFKFGCNIFNFDQFGDERKNAEYRAAFLPGGLFNAAEAAFPCGVRKCINGVYVGENWPAFISKLAAVVGGKVRFRGFKGRYRLDWKDAEGQRRFVEVSLK